MFAKSCHPYLALGFRACFQEGNSRLSHGKEPTYHARISGYSISRVLTRGWRGTRKHTFGIVQLERLSKRGIGGGEWGKHFGCILVDGTSSAFHLYNKS